MQKPPNSESVAFTRLNTASLKQLDNAASFGRGLIVSYQNTHVTGVRVGNYRAARLERGTQSGGVGQRLCVSLAEPRALNAANWCLIRSDPRSGQELCPVAPDPVA